MPGEFSFFAMTILLMLNALLWWGFCVSYHLHSKWWKNPYGRNLMSVGALVAAIHTVLVVYVLLDHWTVMLTWVMLVLFLWSAYAVGRRTYLMEKTQRDRH